MDAKLIGFAPFVMVVVIVWIVMQSKTKRMELMRSAGSRSREDELIIGQMQQQIEKLTERVSVLERLVTDDDRRLSQEINRLRDRDRSQV